MFPKFAVVVAVSTCLAAWPAAALAGGHTIKQFGPGAPGIGDPYFPLDGNGGYDVKHYDLDIAYNPSTDVLKGVATIERGRRRTSRASTSTSTASPSAPSPSTAARPPGAGTMTS